MGIRKRFRRRISSAFSVASTLLSSTKSILSSVTNVSLSNNIYVAQVSLAKVVDLTKKITEYARFQSGARLNDPLISILDTRPNNFKNEISRSRIPYKPPISAHIFKSRLNSDSFNRFCFNLEEREKALAFVHLCTEFVTSSFFEISLVPVLVQKTRILYNKYITWNSMSDVQFLATNHSDLMDYIPDNSFGTFLIKAGIDPNLLTIYFSEYLNDKFQPIVSILPDEQKILYFSALPDKGTFTTKDNVLKLGRTYVQISEYYYEVQIQEQNLEYLYAIGSYPSIVETINQLYLISKFD